MKICLPNCLNDSVLKNSHNFSMSEQLSTRCHEKKVGRAALASGTLGPGIK